MQIASLTGFGESPYRNSEATQIAEISAVLKVIENRATSNFRSNSRTLRDIGVSEKLEPRLSTLLADWQFSVWNDKDNRLVRMLNFNPDNADKLTSKKMALAFEEAEEQRDDSIGRKLRAGPVEGLNAGEHFAEK